MQTTSDGLLNRRITVEQPAKGFRIAIDTIFLAAAVPAQAGEKVVDLGCGVGGAMLALACRVADVAVTGVEIQHMLVELCERNIVRNNFGERLNVVEGDVTDIENLITVMTGGVPLPLREGLGEGALSKNPPHQQKLRLAEEGKPKFLRPLPQGERGILFDHVMMNPPYHDETRHDVSPNTSKRTANTASVDVAEWVRAAARFLKTGGTLTIIHRADEQDKLLAALGSLFGDARVLPLLPTEGAAPKRVIIRAIKGVMGSPQTAQPLVLHKAEGGYTDAAESILRHAEALNFALCSSPLEGEVAKT